MARPNDQSRAALAKIGRGLKRKHLQHLARLTPEQIRAMIEENEEAELFKTRLRCFRALKANRNARGRPLTIRARVALLTRFEQAIARDALMEAKRVAEGA